MNLCCLTEEECTSRKWPIYGK